MKFIDWFLNRTVSEATFEDSIKDMFEEEVLPGIRRNYEKDGEIDVVARREEWNNFIDGLIKECVLPDKADDWGLPDEYEG